MTSAGRRMASVIAAASTICAVTWFAGGQMWLDRVDPALVLPWLFPPLLVVAWWMRAAARADRARLLIGVLLLVAGIELALGWYFAGSIAADQVALVLFGGLVAAIAADAIVQWRPARFSGLAVLFASVGWFLAAHGLLAFLYRPAVSAEGQAPVTMITGLPLRWSGEGNLAAMIAEGASDDPALSRLLAIGDVRLVDSLVDHPPAAGGTLFLAHPRAPAPQELVAIDAFVRGGGDAVVLADALSSWPAHRPLGDPRNPPVTSLLTPLLDHWGVTLGAAAVGDAEPISGDIGMSRLRLFSAGRFDRLPSSCRAFADRHVATCTIGAGSVWLVGDADLLFAPLWQPLLPIAPHLRRADTMDWMAQRLWGDSAVAGWRLQPQWIRTAAP